VCALIGTDGLMRACVCVRARAFAYVELVQTQLNCWHPTRMTGLRSMHCMSPLEFNESGDWR